MIWFLCVAGVLLGSGILLRLWTPARQLEAFSGPESGCPDSPNCVCTFDEDAAHQIEPLRFNDSAEEAWSRLIQLLEAQSDCQIVQQTDGYLHATFTTKVFRFVDDVEFLLEESQAAILFRSASRFGRSDLGQNRKRMEHLRDLFSEE